jgi:hypothetical protein
MSLQVNTLVIEALMRLRGFSRKDLALISGVRLENLNAWLRANDGTDHYVSRSNQGKIMQALGISGEGLRGDCVHHWKIREERFARNTYRDIQIMLHAFGDALAVSFQRTSEPALGFSTRQIFGLRFAGATVTLEITAPYLKSITFDPEKLEGLGWAFDKVVCLGSVEIDRLLDGDVSPAEFDDFATGKQDAEKWERLHLIAREYGISPDEVEDFMLARAKQAENQLALGTQVEQTVQWKKVGNGDVAPTTSSVQHPGDAGAEARERLRSKNEPQKKAEVRSMQDYRLFISSEKAR